MIDWYPSGKFYSSADARIGLGNEYAFAEGGKSLYWDSQTGEITSSESGEEYSDITNVNRIQLTGTYADTIKFVASQSFYIVLWVHATNGMAFVDPVVTPDPSNPNITLTADVGPNPNPDAPLLTPDQLAALTPDQLNALGLTNTPSSTPEPKGGLLAGIGILILICVRLRGGFPVSSRPL